MRGSCLTPGAGDTTRDDRDGRDIHDSLGRPVYSHLSLSLSTTLHGYSRAGGRDCRPYHWTPHGPPFYILYIFYTVNYPALLHDLLISTANPVRAAGDCRPYRWTTHGPPLYILYIFYTVNYLPFSTFSTANPVRAAGDCRPYRWTAHTPPILHSLHFLHG